jgi:hypothetical protein
MATILLTGWREGMEKVTLCKLQMEYLNLPLTQSKHNVDKLLNGELIKIEVHDIELAREFIRQADKIGADCTLEV